MRLKCGAETLSLPCASAGSPSDENEHVQHFSVLSAQCQHTDKLPHSVVFSSRLCGNYAWMLSSRVDSFALDVTCVSFFFFCFQQIGEQQLLVKYRKGQLRIGTPPKSQMSSKRKITRHKIQQQ